MKKISTLFVALAFGLGSAAAMAGDAAEHSGEKHAPKMRDCSKMENADRKAACEKRHAAMASCKDKAAGEERRACLKSAMGGPAKP